MKRNLDIEIQYHLDGGDGLVELTIRDNESGEFISDTFPYNPDEHHEFDYWIGGEVYSWLSLMADQMDEEESENEN